MLEAVTADLSFTISLKRGTQNLQLSTTTPADYPIYWHLADRAGALHMSAFDPKRTSTAICTVSLAIVANELGDRVNGLRLHAEVTVLRLGSTGVF